MPHAQRGRQSGGVQRQIERHQIGPIAHGERHLVDSQNSSGLDAGHRHGRGQVDAGVTHHADNAGADRLARPGQQIALAGDDEPAIGEDFQRAKCGVVAAGRQAGKARQIADQHDAVGRFRPHKCFDNRRRKMMAIDDQAGREAIFGQLVPEIIRMAAQEGVGTIAQVRAERGARVDRARICAALADV